MFGRISEDPLWGLSSIIRAKDPAAIHALWRLLNVASQTCAFIGFASSRGEAYSVGQFHHYYLSNKEGCNEN